MTKRSRSSRRLGWLAAIVFATWTFTRSAQAESGESSTSVMLVVRDCAPAFEREIRTILRVELGDLLLPDSEPKPSETNLLEVDCQPELTRVKAEGIHTRAVVETSLRFDAFPGDAAPRAVALSGVEALSAVNPTLSERLQARREAVTRDRPKTNAPPKPSHVVSRSKEPSPIAAPGRFIQEEPRRSLHLRLGAIYRRFLITGGAGGPGARIELSWRPKRNGEFGLDLDAVFARRRVSLGRLLAVMMSSSAWFGFGASTTHWSATIAPAARVGLVELRGDPGDADVRGHGVLRVWAGPALNARLSARLEPLEVSALSEAGLAVLGAEGLAEEFSLLKLKGPWLSASLNFGIGF